MARQSSRKRGLRWWDAALIMVGVPTLVLLIWLWIRHRAEQETASSVGFEIAVSPPPPRMPKPDKKPAPDDLRRIEGIGPRTANLLQASGITSFAQLAATSVEQLRSILREANVRANPTTWPEQADLASTGKWDALKALQAELKGGVRV